VGRFLSVDPLFYGYPSLSPYPFAMNTPVQAIDLDGLEGLHFSNILDGFKELPQTWKRDAEDVEKATRKFRNGHWSSGAVYWNTADASIHAGFLGGGIGYLKVWGTGTDNYGYSHFTIKAYSELFDDPIHGAQAGLDIGKVIDPSSFNFSQSLNKNLFNEVAGIGGIVDIGKSEDGAYKFDFGLGIGASFSQMNADEIFSLSYSCEEYPKMQELIPDLAFNFLVDNIKISEERDFQGELSFIIQETGEIVNTGITVYTTKSSTFVSDQTGSWATKDYLENAEDKVGKSVSEK
jgi:hypothetical protein